MDRTTEQHLEDLCLVLHAIGETLENFTEQNGTSASLLLLSFFQTENAIKLQLFQWK